ncbi:SDR family oxidoreductase [Chromatocurvus halotolerans]|uniref:NADP-dependent 3-hydroxy acid dehydrogenase YdfG n=1 Tax=Chromatocurvus halotolerans TaxID=1132028 RepID=A0A4R2L9N8_9GAMM|nr:SDR family oxidoreductase [Chromatocurvus halotolerans]TCO75955.1 NADP-dependent 3-hydroxy acid dehydrogenase YdfG [Chromatocurvus halotolerans]
MPIAIITGASAGIGHAAAELFRDAGYSVYNLSRRPCLLTGVENLRCDLRDRGSVEAAMSVLLPAVEQSDTVALVHNASQMLKDSALDCSDEALAGVLGVNVIGINTLNQRLLPVMPASSSVIYVGSTLSEKAVAGAFSYVVSKHAQLGMMRATCQDLMGKGVHTALVCPGFTDTEMLRTHLGNDEDTLRAIGGSNSFGRLVAPEEIAELIIWAHEHPVINGTVIHANLGQRES